ncbi:MAG: sulfite exporter TauE/SafE family protein [Ignavibacteriaceae bacterium]
MESLLNFTFIFLSAVGAGFVNALAGGGTLISFPVLIAIGVPPVAANVTNTIALCPGYLGATLAQIKELKNQLNRLWLFLPAAVIGGILGGVLLLNSGEKIFSRLIPYLILIASLLLAVQEPLRKWLIKKTSKSPGAQTPLVWNWLPVGVAAIYGGYFGAGLSVIVLAVLALTIDDTLTRLNALKQFISFSVNIAAAVFFLFSGQVLWIVALIMAFGALIGGVIGGKTAGYIKPGTLRIVVVIIGIAVAIIYMIKQ